MREEKRIITVAPFEHDLLINGFNEFRNKLLEEERPTEDVDDLLIKLIDAPVVKEKRRYEHEER